MPPIRRRLREVLDRRMFASERARRQVLRHLLLAALLAAVAAVAVRRHLAVLTDPAAARATVRSFGVWAPVALVVLQALQVVVAPVPGQVLAVVAGYLFGPWWGTLYNMVGIAVGSTAAFWLSRRYGRAYVERQIDPDALASFDDVVDQYGLLALFVLFLVPGLPDDALCFLGGLTPIPLWKLVVVAVVARTPAFLLVNVAGNLVATGRVGAAVLLLALVGALSLVAYRYRERILRLLRAVLSAFDR
ncbi:MAG: TVP38/TMEM64 family protein [Haloferacaceae archaeon]